MVSITKHIDMEAHTKQKILELWEEVAKQAKQILKNQIPGMKDRREKEKKLWAEI